LQPKDRKFWVPIVLVAALALAVFLGSRGGESNRITDDAQFAKELQALQEDAIPILESIDAAGGEVDDRQKQKLESFHPRLERLLRYRETSISASFLAGKVNRVLRNDLTAEKWLQQTVKNCERHENNLDVANTGLEAHRLLSELYLLQQNYPKALQEAAVAVEGQPRSPDYRVARASALIQLKQFDEARADLQTALDLDPENSRAKSLLSFLPDKD
jgi:Flp pilus assembly protein TadD